MNKDHDEKLSSPPTLRDLARATGLSLGTVSQALNNKPGVSAETRAKVLETASELGYKLSIRTHADRKLSAIKLFMKQDPTWPTSPNRFYSVILSGAERECRRQGIDLIYTTLEVGENNQIVHFPSMAIDKNIDGYLLIGMSLKGSAEKLKEETRRNIVLVDAYAPDRVFDSIVTDNMNGAYQAVSYLIELGHRRIGLLGSAPGAYPSIRERRKGYFRALKRHNIAEVYVEDGLLTYEDGYRAARRLLERAPEITAIFACNDNVAAAAMNAANDLQLSVPEELSVVGFDDIDLAYTLVPPLTTVHVDKFLMGEVAVRTLRNRLENPSETTLTISLSTRLVIRRSVCPPSR